MNGKTDFNTWLLQPENVERFQGITRDKYVEIMNDTVKELEELVQAGIIPSQLLKKDYKDEPLVRLERFLSEGSIHEIGGLLWTAPAFNDAKAAYEEA